MFGVRGAVVAVCSLVLAGASSVPAPASEPGKVIACEGAENTTYSPGLTLLPKRVSLKAVSDYSCHGLGPAPVPAAGLSVGESPAASCVTVNSPRVRERVRYADGRKSVIVYGESIAVRAAGVMVVTLTGRVTEGLGAGGTARRTVRMLPAEPPTACLTPAGLGGVTGVGALRITTG
ncbi:hypothetical protein AB8O64_31210 [Streptomyces sp. QH1-20]|uniref:hypothetical protein n=1 Tax=Streptomyces sp. QH1-20 TaxID=3240934 RepID=UPI0035159F05